MRNIRGVVRGKTIELMSETGLPDGLEITIAVKPIKIVLSPADDIRDVESQAELEELQRRREAAIANASAFRSLRRQGFF